ncbi:MAG TPA: TfoX/Sxy family protein [Azospira sp.]|nr:TfoX/Sxy family protein [Azospira sp.]
MGVSREYVDYLLESLMPLGRVMAKRMFGGAGLFLDGLMFAIVIDDQLWLKADDANRAEFTALDLPPFTYQRQGKVTAMNFYRAPDEALDAPHALLPWARSAFGAALRGAAAKAPGGGKAGRKT